MERTHLLGWKAGEKKLTTLTESEHSTSLLTFKVNVGQTECNHCYDIIKNDILRGGETQRQRKMPLNRVVGWVTAYLFRMMKIFPSRQPFVVLVPTTVCQICFSSSFCLHTDEVSHTLTSTHSILLDHNCFESALQLTLRALLPAQHICGERS